MSFVSREVKPYFERSITPVINFLSARGIHPNLITFGGFVLIVLGSVALYHKLFLLAFLLLGTGALLDAVDGAVARRLDLVSEMGAFLDSTVDRFSDAAPFVSLGIMYAAEGEPAGVGLSLRAERWIVLLLGVISGLIPLALLVIAVGSLITTLQRIYEVRKNLDRRIP